MQYFDKPGSSKIGNGSFRSLGGGLHFQVNEVARCVHDGRLGSWGWRHDKTLLEIGIFDEVSAVHSVTTVASLAVITRFDAKADTVFLGMLIGCHE